MRIRLSRTSQKTQIQSVVLCSAAVAAIAAATAAPTLAATARSAGTSAIASSATAAPRGWKPGWLVKPPVYIGRYRLLSSTSRSGKRQPHVSGALTLFMQHAYAGKPPIPSGIMSLHTREYDVVLYLTELDHDGTTLESLVHGGAFVAPATGMFTLSKLAGGRIVGTLKQNGLPTQTLTFKRFSAKPQP